MSDLEGKKNDVGKNLSIETQGQADKLNLLSGEKVGEAVNQAKIDSLPADKTGDRVVVAADKVGSTIVVEDQTKSQKVEANREAIPNKKDYLKSPEAFKKAMENFSKWFVDNKVDFDSFASATAKIKNTEGFSQEELKDFYDLLSKGELSRESNMKYTAETFQKLLAKMSLAANEMAKNGGIDGKIGNFTLNAAGQWMEVIIKGYSRQDRLPLLSMIGLNIDGLGGSAGVKTLDVSQPEGIKKLDYGYVATYSGKDRIELSGQLDFQKSLNAVETFKVASMFYENILRGDMTPYASYEGNAVTIRSTDDKWAIKVSKDGKIGIYGDAGSIKLKDPSKFKGSIMDMELYSTRYEDRPNGEKIKNVIKDWGDVENMELYKNSTYDKLKINNLDIAGVVKVKGDLNVNDAKTFSEAVENKLSNMGDRLKKLGNIKTKAEMEAWKDEGLLMFHTVNDVRKQYGHNIDYSNIELEINPYEFVHLFEATGQFTGTLATIEGVAGALGPITFKEGELKSIMDDVNDGFYSKSISESGKEAIQRRLVDTLINKTTRFKDLDDMAKDVCAQIQDQVDIQTTNTFRDAMWNMIKNGEDALVIGNLGKGKSGMIVGRLNGLDKKTAVFCFIENSGRNLYVNMLKNDYGKATLGMEGVQTSSVGIGAMREFVNKNGWKLYGEAVAKVMGIYNMDTRNVIIKTNAGELPIGKAVNAIGTDTKSIDNKLLGNVFAGGIAEYTAPNGKFEGKIKMGGTLAARVKPYSEKGYKISVMPLVAADFTSKGEDLPTFLKGKIKTDLTANTYVQFSGGFEADGMTAIAWMGNDATNPFSQSNEYTENNLNNPANSGFDVGMGAKKAIGKNGEIYGYATTGGPLKGASLGGGFQKTFEGKNSKTTLYGEVNTDINNLKKTSVQVGARTTTDQLLTGVKKVFKNNKEKPMTDAQKRANQELIEKERLEKEEQDKKNQATN